MELLEYTIKLMCSEDYKERFKAEYWQTKIRFEKLRAMIMKYEEGTLEFEPTCDIELLVYQAIKMYDYLVILEERAEIEGIDLIGGIELKSED